MIYRETQVADASGDGVPGIGPRRGTGTGAALGMEFKHFINSCQGPSDSRAVNGPRPSPPNLFSHIRGLMRNSGTGLGAESTNDGPDELHFHLTISPVAWIADCCWS